MSRASKQAKKERKAEARAQTPSVYSKAPTWLRGTLAIQNAEKKGRIIPNPSYKYPPRLEI